ncbi:hypothetical protein BKA70DRAFT_1535664 [Coprinopsis sp. MPI-PUGE-AT-0042]|nr:hypothetical protein BKA70DRAFT_1535664 [Coprinopsis sp. MPI-PUGE-AT-0042]
MATYTPSNEEWNTYGMMFAASRFASRLASVALWGIQVFMALYGISAYLRMTKERRKGLPRFLVFSAMMLATSSAYLILDTRQVFRNLFNAGPSGRSYVEAFRADAKNQGLRSAQLVTAAMTDMTVIGGDILVLWRCYIVWRSRRWVIVVPFLACFGTIVSRVVGLTFMGLKGNITEGPYAETTMVSESLSVTMNVMATGLILFQLARTWSTVSKAYPIQSRPRMYSNVAGILIESAAPVSIFGICYVIVLAIDYYRKPEILLERGTLGSLAEVVSCLYYSMSALSPQMIIFRVMTGRSWKNGRESNELAASLSQPIRFAAPTTSMTDSSV